MKTLYEEHSSKTLKMRCLKPDQAQSKVNVHLRCISWLVYFQSLIGLRCLSASRLSYELGINVKKKSNENWDIINKNGHSIFHTDKPGNFKSLREIIWIILNNYYFEIDWRWVSVPKKML